MTEHSHQETELFEEENAIQAPNQMFDQTKKPPHIEVEGTGENKQ